MTTNKTYTISELTLLLEEFEDNHPKKNYCDEWYGDIAYMTKDCAEKFLIWVDTRSYE